MDTPLWLIGVFFGYSFVQFWRDCRYLNDRWDDRRIRLYWAQQDKELRRWTQAQEGLRLYEADILARIEAGR